MQLKFKPCLKCFTLTIKGWDYASCVPKIPILRYKAACQKTEKGSAKINTITLLLRPPAHTYTHHGKLKKISEEKRTKIDSFNISELNPRNEIQPDEEYDNISHTAFQTQSTISYWIYFLFFFSRSTIFLFCLFVCLFVLTHYTQSLPTYEWAMWPFSCRYHRI